MVSLGSNRRRHACSWGCYWVYCRGYGYQVTTVVCLWSDWHVGRESMPTYDRAMQVAPKILEHKMLPKKVDAFCTIMLGDLMDGIGVFPSQFALNNTTMPEQWFLTKHVLLEQTRALAKHAETYVFMEPGNHSNISKFAHPHDNFERILYEEIADELRRDSKSIQCVPPGDSDVVVFEVEETTGVAMHRGPKHVETKGARCDALAEVYEHGADWIVSGHLHHIGITSQGFLFMRNGSLMDRGERHAASLHLYESPKQLCFVVDGDSVVGSFWVEFD